MKLFGGRKVGAVALAAGVGLFSAGAFAQKPLGEGDMSAATKPIDVGSAAVLLNRGATTLTLTSDPPRLLGPGTDLTATASGLTGQLEGQHYDVRMSGGRAVGTGPGGKIDVAVESSGGATRVSGTWNGRKVDVSLAPDGIRGNVVRAAVPGTNSIESCRYSVDIAKGNTLTGPARCIGTAEPMRVSVSPADPKVLGSQEVALLFVAYMASPPPAEETNQGNNR